MSKQPAAPQSSDERPSRARASNTAQPRAAAAQPPARHLNASVQREQQAAPRALRDGAGTSATTAARASRVPQSQTWQVEGGEQWERTGEGLGGAEASAPAKVPRGKPSYVPFAGRRAPAHATPPSRPAVDQPLNPYGSVPEERQAAPAPVGAPPRHGGVSTVRTNGVDQAAPAPGGSPPAQQHDPTPWLSGKSPVLRPPEHKKRRRAAFCFTACCILFWLLVIAVGVAVLVVYLLYRPQPPRLRVVDASLNAGYIDELGGRRLALNSDLSVLAAISSPNTKIDIVLHYMQLDLYFQGRLIGTQAVWPAPLREGPGGSVLRNVHIVVSEVPLSRKDAMVWRNATANGGPVVLQLAGRFHTQLNFGRWLPYKYWVYPRCTLWFDPPPSGTPRRVRC